METFCDTGVEGSGIEVVVSGDEGMWGRAKRASEGRDKG